MQITKFAMAAASSVNLSRIPLPFPYKLYAMLEESEKNGTTSVISWLPDGNWFAIHDPGKFSKEIMNDYLPFKTYAAFVEELYRYGFQKPASRQQDEVFYHHRFIRRNKNMCLKLRRKPTMPIDKVVNEIDKVVNDTGVLSNLEKQKPGRKRMWKDKNVPVNVTDHDLDHRLHNNWLSSEATIFNFDYQEYPVVAAEAPQSNKDAQRSEDGYRDPDGYDEKQLEPRTIEEMMKDGHMVECNQS